MRNKEVKNIVRDDSLAFRQKRQAGLGLNRSGCERAKNRGADQPRAGASKRWDSAHFRLSRLRA